MKQFLPFTLLLIPFTIHAQTGWDVEVGGSGLGPIQPYYAPQFITINVGDTVNWTWDSGQHNVYGELDLFPDNPVGFSSGIPVNPPYNYSFVFTVAGVYDYHCTNNDHANTQFGTITVLGGNGIVPTATSKAISLYPNPAQDAVVLDLKGCTGAVYAQVLSLDGAVLREVALQDAKANRIDLRGIPAGTYYLMVDRVTRKKLMRFVKL